MWKIRKFKKCECLIRVIRVIKNKVDVIFIKSCNKYERCCVKLNIIESFDKEYLIKDTIKVLIRRFK